jgi:uncharacterized OB-fold protein
MECQRCKGYADLVLEHNASRLQVIRCFNCGHRTYPPQVVADDDFDGILNLIEEIGDRKHWQWVDMMIKKFPHRY